MAAGFDAGTGGLDPVDGDFGIIQERMEQADGVGAAADAGDQRVGQATVVAQHLLARLAANDCLEFAHHQRVGMRAGHRTDHVEGSSTLATQSRNASLSASLRVREPEFTGSTVAPSSRIR